VHLRGDTLIFTPLVPWVEGDVIYGIGSAIGSFHVDYTPPTIDMREMPCGDTLELPPATLVVRFEDFGSGVNPAACGMQISSPAGTWALRAGHPAVSWDPISNTFTADLSYASFPLLGGINVTVFAGDSPDYTFDGRRDVMPNHSVNSCTSLSTHPCANT
jgi:hypothetical protein